MKNFDWPVGGCRFMKAGKCCSDSIVDLSWFCSCHEDVFKALSNKELLEFHANAVVGGLGVEGGSFIMKDEPSAFDDFYNSYHALTLRGYTGDDILESAGQIVKHKGLLDELAKQLGRDPKWKKFEKIVAGIHTLANEGAIVRFDEKVKGIRSKGNRQIDVSVRFKMGLYDVLIMVECKDYNKAISVDKVEALKSKMEDVGAHKAIMVSKRGCQKSAKALADAYGIEIFTLQEEVEDWTKKIVRYIKAIPFPVAYKFDSPFLVRMRPTSGKVLDDFQIKQSPTGKPFSFKDVVVHIIAYCIKNNIEMPCEIDVRFPEGEKSWQILLPDYTDYIPVYGVKVGMTMLGLEREEIEIDVAPKKITYVYSDADKKVAKFDADEVEKVMKDI